jgi:hypothetical protein
MGPAARIVSEVQRPLSEQEVKVLANAGLDQAYLTHLNRLPTFAERRDWWTAERRGMDPYCLAAFEEDYRAHIIQAAVEWRSSA